MSTPFLDSWMNAIGYFQRELCLFMSNYYCPCQQLVCISWRMVDFSRVNVNMQTNFFSDICLAIEILQYSWPCEAPTNPLRYSDNEERDRQFFRYLFRKGMEMATYGIYASSIKTEKNGNLCCGQRRRRDCVHGNC